jgi:hypothetical protein
MIGAMTDTDKPEVEATAQVLPPVTSLTLPCTLLDLHNWMRDAGAQRSGAHRLANVTGTASALTVT